MSYKQKMSSGNSDKKSLKRYATVMAGATATIMIHEVTLRMEESADEGGAGKENSEPLMTMRLLLYFMKETPPPQKKVLPYLSYSFLVFSIIWRQT